MLFASLQQTVIVVMLYSQKSEPATYSALQCIKMSVCFLLCWLLNALIIIDM